MRKAWAVTVAVFIGILGVTWAVLRSGQDPSPAPTESRLAVPEGSPERPTPVPKATPADQERSPVFALPSPSAKGSLLVRVVRVADRAPVVGAPVQLRRPGDDSRIQSLCGKTDAQGTARYEGLAPGMWEVGSVLVARPKPARVQLGTSSECLLEVAEGLTVVGTVVDGSGAPVSGASIEGGPPLRGGVEALTTTGHDGTFTIRDCPSPFLVGARAAGFASSGLFPIQGASTDVHRLQIALTSPGGVVEGIVTNGSGVPLGGAVIRVGVGRTDSLMAVSPQAPPVPAQVRSDADGKFRAIGVPVGRQPVQVQAMGFAPWRGDYDVQANATVSLRVLLDLGARCEGTVFGVDGLPAADVAVQIGSQGEFFQFFTRTAEDGRYTVDGLPAGQLPIEATDAKGSRARASLLVVPQQPVRCDLRLSDGKELRGRVVDEAGRPVPDVHVQVVAERDGRPVARSGRTDPDGRFDVRGLPDTRRVTVVAEGEAMDRVVKSDVDVDAGELCITVTRSPRSAHIRGVVVGVDGKTAPKITVTGSCRETRDDVVLVAGTDGSFDLGGLRPGTWRLEIDASGFAAWRSKAIQLSENATVDLGSICLSRGGALQVTVVGPEAERCRLTVLDDEGARVDSLTGPRTSPLRPGAYTLSVGGRGIASKSVPFMIRDGEDTTLQLTVESGVAQQFEFRVPDGAPGVFDFEVHRDGVRVLTGLVGQTKQGHVAERWFAPGEHVVVVNDQGLRANVRFTVGSAPGAPVVVPVHR